MTDWESAPSSVQDTPPALDTRVSEERHALSGDSAVLLEFHGVFFEPVGVDTDEDLPLAARSEAITVMPTQMIGRYIKEKTKSLSADADRARQTPPTRESTSKERIEYASGMALLAGQKLILREVLELLMEASASNQPLFGNIEDIPTE